MTLECINPEDYALPRRTPHVIVATGSRLILVAGQEPEDEQGALVGPGDRDGPDSSPMVAGSDEGHGHDVTASVGLGARCRCRAAEGVALDRISSPPPYRQVEQCQQEQNDQDP
jgi:hypothetical protein